MTHEPIHELIRQAAARFSDRPAIQWEEQHVTYRQLEDRANEIAASLLSAGAQKGDLVGILASMTADVVAAILGTLKAGCAFVPLDIQFPAARLEVAAAEVRPRWWLVDAVAVGDLDGRLRQQGLAATVLPLEQGWMTAPPAEPAPAPVAVELDPDFLCYVYFTSGSTGRPKGIGGRLKALDHFAKWQVETFGMDEGTRMPQVTSFAFDGFLHEAFAPLICGGTFVVSSERETLLDPARLAAWFDGERITIVHCTPSLFRSLMSQELRPDLFPALRHIALAGEAVQPADVRRWHSVFGDRIQLVNLYGPTETTLTKFVYFIKPEDANERSISIGQPMPGARAIVVDDKGQPCPPGKLGEIYIRTPYRTHGYVNLPELTGTVFIQNPFSDRPDDIVYKTGDLGRLREDGNYEFVGRRDHQVKVRGVRIELGPIEDLLRSHEAVADVTVIDRVDTQANKFLCAYLVLKHELDPAVLRELLLARLPESMVPSAFVVLEELPRTLNGKIDRQALPDPGAAGRPAREYVPPRTPAEEKLCAMYSELLRIPQVGIRDNFFELGGHSLLVMQLLARIRNTFTSLPLGQVFQTPTVEGLAMAITKIQLQKADAEELSRLVTEIENLPEAAIDELLRSAGQAGQQMGA